MVKQIFVDLDVQLNPAPQIVKAFKDGGAEDLFAFDRDNKSEYLNESRVFSAARASKKPIKHNVFALYRKQIGNQEFCYFMEKLVAIDYWGNKIDWSRRIGKFEVPILTHKWGLDPTTLKSDSQPEPGYVDDPEVDSWEEMYPYEWHSMRDQLLKWKEQGIINDKSIFYAVIGGRTYSMPFSWDQWLNLSIQDLELLGLHGKKYNALLTPGDPTALQLLRDTIKQEIAKGLVPGPVSPQKT